MEHLSEKFFDLSTLNDILCKRVGFSTSFHALTRPGAALLDISRETVISLEEAARKLDVTTKTVRNWALRQVGPVLETAKFGGKVVTTLEALQRFGQQRGAKPSKQSAVRLTRRQKMLTAQLREHHGI